MKIITLTLIIFACSYIVTAQNVTVSSMATLQTAVNNAIAGDTITLLNGVYLNNTLTVNSSNITITAQNSGGVFLNGTNAIILNGNYISFSGFQFTSGTIVNKIIKTSGG